MEKVPRCRRTPLGSDRPEVCVQGWIRTRRDSKAGFSFLELNDGSCFGNIQVIAEAALPNYESEIKRLSRRLQRDASTGWSRPRPARGRPPRSRPRRVTVHGMADAETYPLQKKGHSFEFLRTIAHLRPRTNTFGAIARVRNCVCSSIHEFFQEEGFLYVHTPIITASDCEGAGAMFQVTTLDLDKRAQEGRRRSIITQDFFDRPAYLTVSGQLEGRDLRLRAGQDLHLRPDLPRRELATRPRHLAEFWMVEPEMAFFDLADNMDLAERFLKRIFRDVLEKCPEDMEFFNERIDKTVIETLAAHRRQRVRPRCRTPRRSRSSKKSGQTVRVPGRLGQRPAGRARAVPDREALQVAR